MKFRTVNLFPMGVEVEFLRRFNVRLENLKQPYPLCIMYYKHTHARREKNNNIIHRIALDATASGEQ